MSQPGSTSPVASAPTTKHNFNVYSMMLLLSFIALTVGAMLLYYELTKYGSFPYWRAGQATSGG
jgi:hypothetical protein